jgi:hypothetical protein
VAATVLAACAPGQESTPATPTAATSSTHSVTNKDFEALSERVSALETQMVMTQMGQNQYLSATFDPSSESFERIDSPTGVGSFAVSIQDVRQFGDGVRLKMHFGNLSSARFNNVKVKFKYGPRQPVDYSKPGWSQRNQEWQQALQTKEVTLTVVLRPGSWNPVEVTLPGIATDKFGYVEISLSASQIELAKN